MKKVFSLICVYLIFSVINLSGQLDNIKTIKKIDIHTHIFGDAPYLREIMDELNLKMFSICNFKEGKTDEMEYQIKLGREIFKEYPRYYAWCTTFDLTDRNKPGWMEKVIKKLKDDFNNGAVAVKVWRDVGLKIKNPDGSYLQIDNPVFDPIFDFIEKEGKTLFTHIGEPIQAWMPVELDSRGNPTGYWSIYPDMHFWNKPYIPSYNQIIEARDRMLEKHTNLKIVGCHLGSLEFDVNEIAKRFYRYPNFTIDTAWRINYLMDQNNEKVRAFIIKYQDRILWGTDILAGRIPSKTAIDLTKIKEIKTPEQIDKEKNSLIEKYTEEFKYYATNEKIKRGGYYINGLALPENVLRKIFYENAVKWIAGSDMNF